MSGEIPSPLDTRFEVKNREIEEALYQVGQELKKRCPPGVGFALLMFDFGEGGGMFYASNAQRVDMIKAMKEFIQKHEDKEDVITI